MPCHVAMGEAALAADTAADVARDSGSTLADGYILPDARASVRMVMAAIAAWARANRTSSSAIS